MHDIGLATYWACSPYADRMGDEIILRRINSITRKPPEKAAFASIPVMLFPFCLEPIDTKTHICTMDTIADPCGHDGNPAQGMQEPVKKGSAWILHPPGHDMASGYICIRNEDTGGYLKLPSGHFISHFTPYTGTRQKGEKT